MIEDPRSEYEKTPAERVVEMNEAFGNPAGNYPPYDIEHIVRQCRNIFDEYLELLEALGYSASIIGQLRDAHNSISREWCPRISPPDFVEVRDALCDIQVFSIGAQHLLGVVPDDDMHAVIDGVMSRFIKDERDLDATIELHASKGVTDVYFEGEFPKMVMKSASDQPDAPKGKFLKARSYKPTEFRRRCTRRKRCGVSKVGLSTN